MAAIAWERKKTKTEDSGITTLWLEHHQHVFIQCKGGRPTVKGFVERVVWGGGGGFIFGIHLWPLLRDALLGWHLCPK